MWRSIVAQSHTPETFDAYCRKLRWKLWKPSLIVLHNTAIPTLAMRPNGFSESAMRNLEVYYRDKQKWSAGPHLFVDDQKAGIWIFTPLELPGVHSPSWNSTSIGCEMLGDYSVESFDSGRGLAVRRNAVAAIATLCDCLSLQSGDLKLHKEDVKTTHDCPGKHVIKAEVVKEVHDRIVEIRARRAA